MPGISTQSAASRPITKLRKRLNGTGCLINLARGSTCNHQDTNHDIMASATHSLAIRASDDLPVKPHLHDSPPVIVLHSDSVDEGQGDTYPQGVTPRSSSSECHRVPCRSCVKERGLHQAEAQCQFFVPPLNPFPSSSNPVRSSSTRISRQPPRPPSPVSPVAVNQDSSRNTPHPLHRPSCLSLSPPPTDSLISSA